MAGAEIARRPVCGPLLVLATGSFVAIEIARTRDRQYPKSEIVE